MKRFILMLFFAAGVSITATAQKDLVVDANAEIRALKGSFTSIIVSGGIDLFLSQSDAEAVAISASDDKYKQNIKAEVTNGVLNIYYDGDKSWNLRNKKMRAYVSFKSLEKLDASGACEIWVSGEIVMNALALEMSGASDFKGKVKVSVLKMDLSGASDVRIEGTATTVSIQSSGASDVKGYDLVSDICTAKASGASDINITVNKELNAHASGASDIFYKGDAVMKDVHSSGSSTIAKRG